MMRVFFIPTSSSGVMWWRIQSFVEAAWRNGVASFQNASWIKELNDIQPWQGKISDGDKYDPMFIRQFVPYIESGCQQADAVVFQYAHEEGALELFDAIKIKFPHLPILVEIDDNILSVPTYNEAHATFDPRSEIRRRVLSQLRSADGLIVSTPYLAEVFSEYNANISVVQNSIEFRQWDKLTKKKRKGVRIGWAGGNGHGGDFAIIEKALLDILAKHKEATLVLVNGPDRNGLPDFLKGHKQVEHHAASEWVPILKYPAFMMKLGLDIGIAPVVDSAFNRGKSNLKWIENAAMGIPTVASNVGHFAETVKDGIDGFLAEDNDEFYAKLDKLISDRKFRTTMGLRAKERVRQDFNVDKTTLHYVSVLGEHIARKKRGLPIDIVPTPVSTGQEATL